MAETGPEKAIRCIWCGAITVLDINAIITEKAIEIMKKHEQACNLNPLVAKNRALTNSIKQIVRGTSLN